MLRAVGRRWRNPFTVLGIETSCDDTAAALVRSDRSVLAECVASQYAVHAPYGGVVPNLAMRAHKENLGPVIGRVMEKGHSFDAVAVTVGPGLTPCLWQGLNEARRLATEAEVPLVAVNHLEAHVLVSRLSHDQLEFPFLALLVSGGHTQLLLCSGVGQYKQLGTTLDDAVGEAFDKTARLLGIESTPTAHAGRMLELAAKTGDAKKAPFSIPMQRRKETMDFSYSGLKSQVARRVEKMMGELQAADVADIAAAFQFAAAKHLCNQTEKAMAETNVKTLVVGGGVACNEEIQTMLRNAADRHGVQVLAPPPQHCTDNGVMVAWAGVERLQEGLVSDGGDDKGGDSLQAVSRMPLDGSI